MCIVSDGRRKINQNVLHCLTLLGVYQDVGQMKNLVNGEEVTAHLFEYTTSFGLDSNIHFRYPDKGIVPTQIIFCLKEKNQKKINSHRWFFNAFAPLLQVRVSPLGHSLRMLRSLTRNGYVAQCVCSARCRNATWEQEYISLVEDLRSEL